MFIFFQLATCSDKIRDLNEPLLSLDLSIQEMTEHKNVSIEMNSTELNKLIDCLESANKVFIL